MSIPVDSSPAVVVEHPTRNRLLAGILALLVLHACAAAAVLIVPLLLAVLISLMLSPAVRLLCRWRLPRPLAATAVLLTLLFLSGALVSTLATPARAFVTQVPKSLDRIQVAMSAFRSPLREANKAGEQLAQLAEFGGQRSPQRVVDAGPSQLAQMLNATTGVVASLVGTVFLTFIFLLHGDHLLRKLVELAPALHLKKDIVMATRNAQHELSTYVITITLINALFGLLTAIALWWMGIADPLLWGGVAAILNFVPFLGPMLTLAVLVIVGFAHFAAPLAALSVPGVFLILHMIEGQLVTPLVVGRRLALDPIMVFMALMLFGWLWGVAGLLIAMPLLTCVRIVAERLPAWSTLARLLAA